MATQIRKSHTSKSNMQAESEGKRNTPGADLVADEVHTRCVDWPLCVTIFPLYDRASNEEHPASHVVGCWGLLAAAFVVRASTPRLGAFEAAGTLSKWPPSPRKYSFEVRIRAKQTRFDTFGG